MSDTTVPETTGPQTRRDHFMLDFKLMVVSQMGPEIGPNLCMHLGPIYDVLILEEKLRRQYASGFAVLDGTPIAAETAPVEMAAANVLGDVFREAKETVAETARVLADVFEQPYDNPVSFADQLANHMLLAACQKILGGLDERGRTQSECPLNRPA